MENQILTDQTLQSTQKTGGVLLAVTLITLGSAALILYLVKESRKKDEEELKQLLNGEPVSVYQPEATTIGGLLTELQGIGSAVFGSSNAAPDNIPADYGCGGSFKKVGDVDEVPTGITLSNMVVKLNVNLNKCGRSVYEFQTYLKNDFGINIPLDGRYGHQTKMAHKEWLKMQNLV
jgi:hypothetical protein|tara:strand:- start:2015 stop:2545 length:531 start_codon:yes stop_codon:yes gene_type:complete